MVSWRLVQTHALLLIWCNIPTHREYMFVSLDHDVGSVPVKLLLLTNLYRVSNMTWAQHAGARLKKLHFHQLKCLEHGDNSGSSTTYYTLHQSLLQ